MAIILREKAYIPSISEYDAVRGKYLAFMDARLSEKAKKDGAWESETYGTGQYFLRSAFSKLYYYNNDYYGKKHFRFFDSRPSSSYGGTLFSVFYDASPFFISPDNTDAGLRVAFNLIYNPECDLAKTCRMVKRQALVYSLRKDDYVTWESEAPIVTFGKYDCIWLNKEECEAAYARGETALMNLWTLDLVAKAEMFAEKGNHNDYARAEKLRAQCESIFTQEELDQMVTMEMSSKDGYEKATPMLETETKTNNEEESE